MCVSDRSDASRAVSRTLCYQSAIVAAVAYCILRLARQITPTAFGARYGYILSPLTRLVPAKGIFSLPLRDWCPLRVYSLSPYAIGARQGYILSPLTRLVPAINL
eukprot:4150649-Pyramimonas_sp.AAC.1